MAPERSDVKVLYVFGVFGCVENSVDERGEVGAK
jgi:hypothetical protein